MTDFAAARLTADLAARYADIALGHVGREYPNKLDHVLDGAGDAQAPRALHPIFYGSFDWHSCVHAYWMLATLLRLYPDGEAAPRVAALFDAMLTEEKVEGELAYLQRPSSRGFERPYGWAWLLALQGALEADPSAPSPWRGGSGWGAAAASPAGSGDATSRSLPSAAARPPHPNPPPRGEGEGAVAHAGRWAAALRPLAEAFAERFRAFLPKADYPIRTGSHANTAFALRLAFDYAWTVEDAELVELIRERAQRWYGQDRDAPAWEPSGDDFLSPILVEAQLMSDPRVNPHAPAWLAAFLPQIEAQQPAALFAPVGVSDRSDGKIAHLDGLNLTRAWAWRELAGRLPPVQAEVAHASAGRHLDAALPHVAGDYMGEHWLATYATLALTAG